MTNPSVAPPDSQIRLAAYTDVFDRIEALLDGETDWIAAMATVACELHHTFDYYDWTGFYRAVSDDLLVVGPYQGTHGCLRIPFDRGVCGAAARTRETQFVPDVEEAEDHIACSSSTRSEVVVPVIIHCVPDSWPAEWTFTPRNRATRAPQRAKNRSMF